MGPAAQGGATTTRVHRDQKNTIDGPPFRRQPHVRHAVGLPCPQYARLEAQPSGARYLAREPLDHGTPPAVQRGEWVGCEGRLDGKERLQGLGVSRLQSVTKPGQPAGESLER